MNAFVLVMAFLALVCWGIGDFFIQRSVRKVGDVHALFFIGVGSTLVLAPFVFSDVLRLLGGDWIFLIGIGVFTFVMGIINFEALKRGKLSVVEVIFEIELPFTIVLGLFVFRETVTFMQLGLMGLVFVGVSLVAMRDYPPHLSQRMEKGVVLALLTALGLGLLDFFTASAARSYSPLLAIWLPWATFTVAALLVMIRRGSFHHVPSQLRIFVWLLLPMVVLDVTAWVSYAYALEAGSLAIVTAITESYPALALVLGIWFNREVIKKHQALGAGLALVASIVLALTVF